ncbi:hypothetical protein J2W56_005910 [Nocardia kruczakiae]|uniref:Uncharacterized protein n=1 Tax=Nocardia kruczakiae TaxID=261477 RepID=A0ABU1XNQ2_9NOCA|nr:hypothetical protein [Nocardia kruczakiae]MDR7172149.1 hypothetical protein [Nocardia kruczakiae]
MERQINASSECYSTEILGTRYLSLALAQQLSPTNHPESLAAEPISPRPDEPDLMVSIHLTANSPHPLTFVACESAARRFADHWRRYGRCGNVEFAPADGRCGRLPCERLWLLP